MNYLSNEVIVGIVTFLLPILFAVVKRGLSPYFVNRATAKAEAQKRADKSRENTVEALKQACNSADISALRVLIPRLISIGELPNINVVLDYVEKEQSHRLKKLKKVLLAECKKDEDIKETVQIAVANSPAIAVELSDLMVKLA